MKPLVKTLDKCLRELRWRLMLPPEGLVAVNLLKRKLGIEFHNLWKMEKVVQTFTLQTCTRSLQKMDNFQTTTRACLKDASSTSLPVELFLVSAKRWRRQWRDVLHLQELDDEERTPGFSPRVDRGNCCFIHTSWGCGWMVCVWGPNTSNPQGVWKPRVIFPPKKIPQRRKPFLRPGPRWPCRRSQVLDLQHLRASGFGRLFTSR